MFKFVFKLFFCVFILSGCGGSDNEDSSSLNSSITKNGLEIFNQLDYCFEKEDGWTDFESEVKKNKMTTFK
ncbi:hypothetical protein [Vibrio aphrogenes]|uniref:hypothetical protein n=1 Tax=Vibrio aphrogenes TaxID=1891186 RepID=UPI000B350004|nr:hypothetical protein [Vibrio aphrogenes]